MPKHRKRILHNNKFMEEVRASLGTQAKGPDSNLYRNSVADKDKKPEYFYENLSEVQQFILTSSKVQEIISRNAATTSPIPADVHDVVINEMLAGIAIREAELITNTSSPDDYKDYIGLSHNQKISILMALETRYQLMQDDFTNHSAELSSKLNDTMKNYTLSDTKRADVVREAQIEYLMDNSSAKSVNYTVKAAVASEVIVPAIDKVISKHQAPIAEGKFNQAIRNDVKKAIKEITNAQKPSEVLKDFKNFIPQDVQDVIKKPKNLAKQVGSQVGKAIKAAVTEKKPAVKKVQRDNSKAMADIARMVEESKSLYQAINDLHRKITANPNPAELEAHKEAIKNLSDRLADIKEPMSRYTVHTATYTPAEKNFAQDSYRAFMTTFTDFNFSKEKANEDIAKIERGAEVKPPSSQISSEELLKNILRGNMPRATPAATPEPTAAKKVEAAPTPEAKSDDKEQKATRTVEPRIMNAMKQRTPPKIPTGPIQVGSKKESKEASPSSPEHNPVTVTRPGNLNVEQRTTKQENAEKQEDDFVLRADRDKVIPTPEVKVQDRIKDFNDATKAKQTAAETPEQQPPAQTPQQSAATETKKVSNEDFVFPKEEIRIREGAAKERIAEFNKEAAEKKAAEQEAKQSAGPAEESKSAADIIAEARKAAEQPQQPVRKQNPRTLDPLNTSVRSGTTIPNTDLPRRGRLTPIQPGNKIEPTKLEPAAPVTPVVSEEQKPAPTPTTTETTAATTDEVKLDAVNPTLEDTATQPSPSAETKEDTIPTPTTTEATAATTDEVKLDAINPTLEDTATQPNPTAEAKEDTTPTPTTTEATAATTDEVKLDAINPTLEDTVTQPNPIAETKEDTTPTPTTTEATATTTDEVKLDDVNPTLEDTVTQPTSEDINIDEALARMEAEFKSPTSLYTPLINLLNDIVKNNENRAQPSADKPEAVAGQPSSETTGPNPVTEQKDDITTLEPVSPIPVIPASTSSNTIPESKTPVSSQTPSQQPAANTGGRVQAAINEWKERINTAKQGEDKAPKPAFSDPALGAVNVRAVAEAIQNKKENNDGTPKPAFSDPALSAVNVRAAVEAIQNKKDNTEVGTPKPAFSDPALSAVNVRAAVEAIEEKLQPNNKRDNKDDKKDETVAAVVPPVIEVKDNKENVIPVENTESKDNKDEVKDDKVPATESKDDKDNENKNDEEEKKEEELDAVAMAEINAFLDRAEALTPNIQKLFDDLEAKLNEIRNNQVKGLDPVVHTALLNEHAALKDENENLKIIFQQITTKYPAAVVGDSPEAEAMRAIPDVLNGNTDDLNAVLLTITASPIYFPPPPNPLPAKLAEIDAALTHLEQEISTFNGVLMTEGPNAINNISNLTTTLDALVRDRDEVEAKIKKAETEHPDDLDEFRDPHKRLDGASADLTKLRAQLKSLSVTPTPPPVIPVTTTVPGTTAGQPLTAPRNTIILRKLPAATGPRVNGYAGKKMDFSKLAKELTNSGEIIRAKNLMEHLKLKLEEASDPTKASLATRQKMIDDWNNRLYPLLEKINTRMKNLEDVSQFLTNNPDRLDQVKGAFREYAQLYEILYNDKQGIRSQVQTTLDKYAMDTVEVKADEVFKVTRLFAETETEFQKRIEAECNKLFQPNTSPTTFGIQTSNLDVNLITQAAICVIHGDPTDVGKPPPHANFNTKTFYTIETGGDPSNCEIKIKKLRDDLDPIQVLTDAAMQNNIGISLNLRQGTQRDDVKKFFSTYFENPPTKEGMKQFLTQKIKTGECLLKTGKLMGNVGDMAEKVVQSYMNISRDAQNKDVPHQRTLAIALDLIQNFVNVSGGTEKLTLMGDNAEIRLAAKLICAVMQKDVKDPDKQFIFKYRTYPQELEPPNFSKSDINRTRELLKTIDKDFMKKLQLMNIEVSKDVKQNAVGGLTGSLSTTHDKAGIKQDEPEVYVQRRRP